MRSSITIIDSPVMDDEIIVISRTAIFAVVKQGSRWKAVCAFISKANGRRERYPLPQGFVLSQNMIEALDTFEEAQK